MPNKKSSYQNMFLDPDRNRLVRRIAAVTDGDLTTDQIKSVVVDGNVDLLKNLSAPSKQKVAALVAPDKCGELEKVIGQTVDFVPVSFIERAGVSAKAAARVIDKHRRPLGTAVTVSPRLIMTNNHVVADVQAASSASAQFDYQLALDDVPEAVTEFKFDPATFFWTSPDQELDVSLIAIGPRITGERPLEHYGWTALSSAQDNHAEGDHVTIIEHPEGD
jgi:endonuclease G